MEWLLQDHIRQRGLAGPDTRGVAMKIYLLMLLIGAIAALSHVDFGRKSPERKA